MVDQTLLHLTTSVFTEAPSKLNIFYYNVFSPSLNRFTATTVPSTRMPLRRRLPIPIGLHQRPVRKPMRTRPHLHPGSTVPCPRHITVAYHHVSMSSRHDHRCFWTMPSDRIRKAAMYERFGLHRHRQMHQRKLRRCLQSGRLRR